MARQRSSPYLPGIRSRLWRFVAAGPARGERDAAAAGDATPATAVAAAVAVESEAPTLGLEVADTPGLEVPSTTRNAVIAVFRRLPLELDDEA